MTTYSPTDLEAFVKERAPAIAADIRRAAQQARIESDLVDEVEKLLERFARTFGIDLRLDRERTLILGRADAVYNRFVIEYEKPGSLRQTNLHGKNRESIKQVKDYMESLERVDRQRKERLAGVVLDGSYYIFVRYRGMRWHIDDPVRVDAESTEIFLHYLLALSTELALTPENLMRDFGENSNISRRVVPALYTALSASTSQRTDVLFRQWKRQFREVTGYDPSTEGLDLAAAAKLFAVKDRPLDAERLFFCIHTYYATFIKLLALQIAHYYVMPEVGTGLAAVAKYDTEPLHQYLVALESGGVFSELGIRNFLEGDFFGWYLDEWDEPVETAIRRLIADLASYSLVTLDVDPEETRDLLKLLYENLMPKKLRHALGEYYTPDWLADRLLNQLTYRGDPRERLLDPACGSGTFLVLAIRRVRQYADEKKLQPARVLEQILENVVGYDLNPLAVISARTNYLLALGDLLSHRTGPIAIPVYLADSILTPSMETGDAGQLTLLDNQSDTLRQPGYTFNTAVGRFTVPSVLVDAHYIDQFAYLLEESVHLNVTNEQFRRKLRQTFPFQEETDEADIQVALTLFDELSELERQGINGIWARIVKNAFAPLFQGRFDYVAGNPPWVNWESLPASYRDETARLWDAYDISARDPHGTRQASQRSKTDLSILMFAVCADQYLSPGGRLGFIITQVIFKTERGGRGFRRFLSSDARNFQVLHVDDLSELKVFEGAANRTSIFIGESGTTTKYPVPYSYWRKRLRGSGIRSDLTLSEALDLVRRADWVAQPVSPDDASSPWISGRRAALNATLKLRGESPYYEAARQGANTRGANGILWVEKIAEAPGGTTMVANLASSSRSRVDAEQAVVESDILYPLLRSQDLIRWAASPTHLILLPYDPGAAGKPIPESTLRLVYPRAYEFVARFRSRLISRKRFRNFDPRTSSFYELYNVGDYSFSPYKVVWARIASSMKAAVAAAVDGKPVVPQETITFVPVEDEQEAHYLCAALNSAPFDFVVQSFSERGGKSFGTPGILRRIQIPEFDRANTAHLELASLSAEAHLLVGGGADATDKVQREVDEASRTLWRLSASELQEVRANLVWLRAQVPEAASPTIA